ncbi:hypothetical protein SCLCIDRAFT_1057403 [Scleroderma citrinum Foug A]|uniref:Uncharacterized protein n=1 Tax=Scleroderma citrinum Foug A TaxID=1036808 RepID=A0A0C3DRD3_9AGAM|nr:hypothetical protein SCLCIDRAFT_1057403 [Scleroderma citrinum Foug A]
MRGRGPSSTGSIAPTATRSGSSSVCRSLQRTNHCRKRYPVLYIKFFPMPVCCL